MGKRQVMKSIVSTRSKLNVCYVEMINLLKEVMEDRRKKAQGKGIANRHGYTLLNRKGEVKVLCGRQNQPVAGGGGAVRKKKKNFY